MIGAPGVLSPGVLARRRGGTAVGGGAIRVLDAATGKDAVRLAGGGAVVYGAAVSPDGKTVATTEPAGQSALWDAAAGREQERLGDDVSSIRFLRDGRTLLVAGRGRAQRWDVTTRWERPPRPCPTKARGPPRGPLPGRQGGPFAGASLLVMIDLAAGQGWAAEGGGWTLQRRAFAPDGRTLVVWQPDHTAHVWDLKTHKKLRASSSLTRRRNRLGPPPPAAAELGGPTGPASRRTAGCSPTAARTATWRCTTSGRASASG
ncbi:MAG: WD40 repeat domain-containing protein [Gemmataceae bacterium]